MAPTIALQLYTVRDDLAADFDNTLEAVSRIGYHYVEIAGLHGRRATELNDRLAGLGLTAISSHESFEALDQDPATVVDNASALGIKHVATSFHLPDRDQPKAYRQAAQDYNRIGQTMARAGLTFSYHHHGFEIDRIEGGVQGLEILMNETDPQYVKAQLDVFWVRLGGDDPLLWMRRLAGRMPTLHVKDMAAGPAQNFSEVGTGVIDIAAVVEAAKSYGVEHLIVEQDRHWEEGSPVVSARISFENLSKIVETLWD